MPVLGSDLSKGVLTVLHRGVLYLLILALALMVSPTVTLPVAAVGGTWVVDDDSFDCPRLSAWQ
ncbi:MAG: hypothetical protein AMJ76_03700 [Dehalococcoidia bacterium SM23_28_1]|nr:MAG: hypothetical protein AMJ76_03700 [Dehalococcoidia bacterium SM23_28_1]